MVSVDMGDYTWLMVVGCIIAFGAAMGIGANDAANVSCDCARAGMSCIVARRRRCRVSANDIWPQLST